MTAQPNWADLCAAEADKMADEYSTDSGRKAFHAGNGVERAKREVAKLDALRMRFQKYVSA